MAARDTDNDWAQVGEVDPYFGVTGDHRYHIGQVSADDLDDLYQSGEVKVAAVAELIRGTVADFAPRSALDFGCGVGRDTLAIAARVGSVTGVDISPGMTMRAAEAADRYSVSNCRFATSIPASDFYGWIHSNQVFQHIPPSRGYTIVSDLLGLLEPGGVCSLQFTIFRDRRHVPIQRGTYWTYDGVGADALASRELEGTGSIVLFDYNLNHLLAIMLAEDVELRSVLTTEFGGHHGIWLIGRKSPTNLLVQPGPSYSIGAATSFERFLLDGWSAVEDWGVWTSGPVARLRLRVPPELRSSHALALDGRAFVNGRHPSVRIAAGINGRSPVARVYTESQSEGPLLVPLDGVEDDGLAVVHITVDQPSSPAQCGLDDDDQRELGFALGRIRLVEEQA